MSGFFTMGETKVRPGIYKRKVNISTVDAAGSRSGIGAAVVSGNWGPLNVATVIDVTDDFFKVVGSGSGLDTLTQLFAGGVQSAVVTRIGTGGTAATATLTDDADPAVNVVTATAKYVGTFPLSISIKTSLTDSSVKTVTIYTGTTVLETRSITAGSTEVDGIVSAFADSEYVTMTKIAAGSGTLKEITQSALSGGADPTVNTAAYSAGLDIANTELFDCICVDTNDVSVHAVLAAFVVRTYEGGDYPIAVVSEPNSVAFDTRIAHATAFNDEKMIYVLNGWKDSSDNSIEGYLAAARICGMVASVSSGESLTHTTIDNAATLIDTLTNAQIISAINAGCLVISKAKTGSVMIEKAINTLVTPDSDMDDGWKKIRRTKTRFEMMSRIDVAVEPFVGSVNNDGDGRAAIQAAGQSVLDAMVGEGKLIIGATFALDESKAPTGDSAWFVIQADDADSFETGYLTYQFRFSAS